MGMNDTILMKRGNDMGYVFTKNLVPGMITAADVYNYNDQLIIPANTVLNDNLISKMEYYSIQRINVLDKTADVIPQPSSYSERVVNSREFKEFRKNFSENVESLQDSMQQLLESGDGAIDESALLNETDTLVDPKATSIEVFDMIHNMRQYDDTTYAHCINVSLICRIMAKWLHFSKEDTETLTLCGLLHDIGKLSIPDEIIKKPGKLTDEEFDLIKTHTLRGYEILSRQNLNEHILNSALMHHERCDGSGYPNGLHANEIDEFAKIVAIADVYEAMTAARVYRGPQCPFKVISIFEEEGLQKYAPQYILTFLERIVSAYINNNVRLSNGQVGEVIMINPGRLSRPMVKAGDTYIDLSKELSITIDDLV